LAHDLQAFREVADLVVAGGVDPHPEVAVRELGRIVRQVLQGLRERSREEPGDTTDCHDQNRHKQQHPVSQRANRRECFRLVDLAHQYPVHIAYIEWTVGRKDRYASIVVEEPGTCSSGQRGLDALGLHSLEADGAVEPGDGVDRRRRHPDRANHLEISVAILDEETALATEGEVLTDEVGFAGFSQTDLTPPAIARHDVVDPVHGHL
jgi:hypothetical protein